MAHKTKIRAIGNSQGVTIPKAILDRYNLHEGDNLTMIEMSDGIHLTRQDDAFDKGMEAYRRGASKYRNAMRELSK